MLLVGFAKSIGYAANNEQKADEMHVSPAIAKSPCNLKTVEVVKKVVNIKSLQ